MRRRTPGSTGTRRQSESAGWSGHSLVIGGAGGDRSGIEFEGLTHALKLLELVVEFALHGKFVDLGGLMQFQTRPMTGIFTSSGKVRRQLSSR